jgi:hypothetical protein
MFEPLENGEEAPQVSLAMTIGILAAHLVGVVGGLCVFISLAERPLGVQIATAIMYTYFAFWYVFFPTRGMLEKYSLRNKTVQGRVPLLLAIHCAFLILIFLGETIWFSMKPDLPSYWFREDGGRGAPWYVLLVLVSVTVVFFVQVLVSRRILSRSLRKGLNRTSNPPSSIDSL